MWRKLRCTVSVSCNLKLCKAVFARDFFFRGPAVTYRDIPEGDSTVRPHVDFFLHGRTVYSPWRLAKCYIMRALCSLTFGHVRKWRLFHARLRLLFGQHCQAHPCQLVIEWNRQYLPCSQRIRVYREDFLHIQYRTSATYTHIRTCTCTCILHTAHTFSTSACRCTCTLYSVHTVYMHIRCTYST